MLYDETIKIEKIIQNATKKINSKLYTCNTICRATYLRQKAAKEVCKKKPDLTFVVGGYESSNTTNLYKLAQKYSPTYYIKDAASITSSKITHFIPEQSREIQTATDHLLKKISLIAILAGASCPFTVVNEVVEKLTSY